MWYWAKEEMSGAMACEAVAHSAGKGALAQEPEVGAMAMSCATGSAWRAKRCGGEGSAEVRESSARMLRVVRNIVGE